MKKFFLFVFIAFITSNNAFAVLDEKNLGSTLAVLRQELEMNHNDTQRSMIMSKELRENMQSRVMQIMSESNQIALMLYSQKMDYIFDLTVVSEMDVNNMLHERDMTEGKSSTEAALGEIETISKEDAAELLRINDILGSIATDITTVDELPEDVYDVVIDPGHGGSEPGAIGCLGDKEKDTCSNTCSPFCL